MDKINIRAAAGCDLERVMDFYHSLIDAMKDAEYKPGWKKGIYPTRESIADYIAAGELCIGESDGQIVSSMAVNHEFNEGYRSAGWSVLSIYSASDMTFPAAVLPLRWCGSSLIKRGGIA